MTIEQLRSLYAQACTRVAETADAIEALPDTATADEVTAATTANTEAVADAERAKQAMTDREAVQRSRDAHPAPATVDTANTADTSARSTGHAAANVNVQVNREPEVYFPGGPSVFRDLILARTESDAAARERLNKHARQVPDMMMHRARDMKQGEERNRLEAQSRAISQTATAGGEFIPPLWLNDQYAGFLRAGRAFADQCYSQVLPDGTNSINFPKITTGATAAVQTDGGAVSNTDQVTTSVTAQVQTIAGRSIASYQLVDMSQPGIDEVIYKDILGAYWQAYDVALISGNVTNAKGFLNVAGINAVTYTDATPTGPELYTPMFQGKAQIDKGAFAPVNFTLWHPSTWDWYLSQLDTANRPLALATDLPSFNAMAQFNGAAQGIAGNFSYMPVVIDANVPVNLGAGTNESRIGLFNRETLYTWEGVPRFKVADQTNIANLQYQFVMYGYYANAFARQPKMISVLSGTGLIVAAGF